ncbi:MAG: superoxide dismutase [Flavobacteriia bacterium]|nr:superoxide dismutase [Flavobacteriia bacterium]
MKKILFLFVLLANYLSFSQSPYTLPQLKYTYAALEPSIDSTTMIIHHTKHHQAYVNNLNKAIAGTKLESLPLEELLLNATLIPDAVRNNAGGHYNHSLFWEILTPKKDTKPSLELFKAIETNFKNIDSLKKLMNQAASTRFGSGWAWLILTPDKKLAVTSTANQDNPIMDVASVRGIPLIGIDVWEHAYYLKYQNKRTDYLGAIWNLIDWETVSLKYMNALSNPLLEKIEKDNWKELKDFYKIIIETCHPLEENNFGPIRELSGELYLKALILKKSTIPTSLKHEKTKLALEKMLILSKEIHAMVEKNEKEEHIRKKMEELHTTFHEVQAYCMH